MLFRAQLISASESITETLTQDVTLPKRSFGGVVNIPYFFQNYTIGTGVTLTIAPGVVCKFWYGGQMTVNNGLIAEGLPQMPEILYLPVSLTISMEVIPIRMVRPLDMAAIPGREF